MRWEQPPKGRVQSSMRDGRSSHRRVSPASQDAECSTRSIQSDRRGDRQCRRRVRPPRCRERSRSDRSRVSWIDHPFRLTIRVESCDESGTVASAWRPPTYAERAVTSGPGAVVSARVATAFVRDAATRAMRRGGSALSRVSSTVVRVNWANCRSDCNGDRDSSGVVTRVPT